MASLRIKKLSIRNFRSYGDYDTEINLDGLGPVLILGEIGNNPEVSNGSGKSSIADAIVWCLYGRLPYKAKPAGHVVNKKTGKNCIVKIETTDGYKIIRTRDYEGHNDLLIKHPNGDDISDSTNQNAQQHLNKLFDLDYDIFISSVFFAQFGGTFLELSDQKRKKALERMLHLDRFDYYVEVCKENIDSLSKEQAKHIAELDSKEKEISRITQNVEQNLERKEQYEAERKENIKQKEDKLNVIDHEYEEKTRSVTEDINKGRQELNLIKTYDIEKIKQEWLKHQKDIKDLDNAVEKLQRTKDEISRLMAQKEHLEELNFSISPEQKKNLLEKLRIAQDELKEIELVDIVDLNDKWSEYEKSSETIKKINDGINSLNLSLIKVQANIKSKKKQIEEWKEKEGEICQSCGQEIRKDHILKQCVSPQDELNTLEAKLPSIEDKILKLQKIREKSKSQAPEMTLIEAKSIQKQYQSKQAEIKTLKDAIDDFERQKKEQEQKELERDGKVKEITENITNKISYVEKKEIEINQRRENLPIPEVTINEAIAIKSGYDSKNKEILTLEGLIVRLGQQLSESKNNINEEIQKLKIDPNPYDIVIDDLKEQLKSIKKIRSEAKKKVAQSNQIIKYVEYIRSAYSDRKKIKSFILSNLIPFLNERILYYLDAFECGYSLKFTNSLQTQSELWPYEMWSGGERKKIDLALMFAIHDLHSSIYDQKCNILVFDEVDGRLDLDGINKFTEIIFNEFGNKNSILVISHKDQMRDAFPTKIIVKKDLSSEDGCSHIEEVR